MSKQADAVCRYVLANGELLPNGQFSIAIDSTELGKLLAAWQDRELVTPIEYAIGVLAALDARDFDKASVEDLAVLQYWMSQVGASVFVKSVGRMAAIVSRIDGHAALALGRNRP